MDTSQLLCVVIHEDNLMLNNSNINCVVTIIIINTFQPDFSIFVVAFRIALFKSLIGRQKVKK